MKVELDDNAAIVLGFATMGAIIVAITWILH